MTDEPECQLRRRKVSGNPNLPLNLDVEYLVSDGDPDQGTPSPSNIKRLARTKQKSSSSSLLDYKNKQQSFDIQVEECEEEEIIIESEEEDDEEENPEGVIDRGVTPTPIQDFAANVVYTEVNQTIAQIENEEASTRGLPKACPSQTVNPQLSRILSGIKSLHLLEVDSPQYCRLFDTNIDQVKQTIIQADTKEACKCEQPNSCQCPSHRTLHRTLKPQLSRFLSGFRRIDIDCLQNKSLNPNMDQGPQTTDFLRVKAVEQDCYTDVSDADTDEEDNE